MKSRDNLNKLNYSEISREPNLDNKFYVSNYNPTNTSNFYVSNFSNTNNTNNVNGSTNPNNNSNKKETIKLFKIKDMNSPTKSN